MMEPVIHFTTKTCAPKRASKKGLEGRAGPAAAGWARQDREEYPTCFGAPSGRRPTFYDVLYEHRTTRRQRYFDLMAFGAAIDDPSTKSGSINTDLTLSRIAPELRAGINIEKTASATLRGLQT